MNQDQLKSLIRWVLTVAGGTTAGAAIFAKLGLDPTQFPAFVDALLAAGTALVAVWGFFVHSETNTVAAAAAMPNVVSVTTTNTNAGKALSDAVPSEAVQPAGTAKAVVLANAVGPKPTT